MRSAITYLLERIIHDTPNFKGKTRACVALARPVRGRPIRTAYGPRIECHLDDATNKAAVFGWYGDIIFNVVNKLQLGSAFIDIGANSGLFSIIAANAVGENGKVYAFEPQVSMFNVLKRNMHYNGLSGVTAINKAVSATSGEIGMSHLSARHTGIARVDPDGKQRVRAINLDADMPELLKTIGKRRLVIKIDVEGAEADVLNGMKTLLKHASIVIVEIDDGNLRRFGVGRKNVYEIMEHHGFSPSVAVQSKHFDEIFMRQ